MKKVKQLLSLILIIFILVLVTGCGSTPKATESTATETKSANEPYKIGVVLDISGSSSSLGTPERDTIKLLEKDINTKGGVNGHPVEIIIRDNESDESKSVMAAKDLIEKEKVLVLIGSSASGTTMAMVPTATKAGVPMISAASSIKITEPVAERKYIFKTAFNDSAVASRLAEYLLSKGYTKIAFMYMDNTFGDSGKKEFSKVAAEKGITIAAEEKFGAQDKDMTPQLTRIKAQNVQAVIVWAIPPSASIVTSNFRQVGITAPLIHSHGIGNKKFIELAGDASNNVVFPIGKILVANDLPDSDPQKKVLLDYTNAYKTEFNAEPSTFGGHTYDALTIIIQALSKSGADREKLRQEIENTTGFVGIGGTFNLSPTDHNGLSEKDLVMVEILNGQWKLIK